MDDSAFEFALKCRCGMLSCTMHDPSHNTKKVVLPPVSEPVKYVLHLFCRIDEHEFDGTAAIEVDIREPGMTSLTLNAKELKVHGGSFTGVGEAYSVDLDEATSQVTYSFAMPLAVGVGTLNTTFTGQHNGDMNGFYRSSYKDVHGEEKTMVCTQFESIDARKCFPCWDEPPRKATFQCSLRVPRHMTALSNMPEASSTEHTDGTKTVRFMESPKMSTYLLAFVVGEFDFVSALTKNGVIIRVFGPPGKPNLGNFALECAVAALDMYDEAFGQPYPLPKSDMVAIPEFAAGAMENWGLVTYREVDLLIDEAASSRQRQRVAEVVIHELAHQWFGNLVTMEWWDDLWLNEGFATWMETGITDRLHPDWKMWEQFITDMQGHALDLDALRSSHPIQVPIGRAEEVEQVFDAISYCKGGSVIRLVHSVVGEEAFLCGLRLYMKEFKYGNACTDDLWAAWEKASGEPIKELMGKWTKQMGFPLLEVKGVSKPDAHGNVQVSLSQGWYLADGSAVTAEEEKLWTIPLFAVASGSPGAEPHTLMREATHTLTIKGDGAWVKLNAGQNVPLRVKYPIEMMPRLAEAVRSKLVPAFDRIGLLSDAAALCKARKIEPTSYLELLAAFDKEDEATVLSEALSRLSGLCGLFAAAPELQAPFGVFARGIVMPMVHALGWDPRPSDGHLTRKLRGELISVLPSLCRSDAVVLAEARRRYEIWLADPSDVKTEGKKAMPPEIAGSVLRLVMASGNEKTFETFLRLYGSLALNDDKKDVLCALGYAPTTALRVRALEYSMSEAVKMQDFFYVAISMHRSGADGMAATWDFFKSQLPRYVEKLKMAGSSLMDACIAGACSGFATPEAVEEVRTFFADPANTLPKNERKVTQTLESMTNNMNYLAAYRASKALDWLTAKAKKMEK